MATFDQVIGTSIRKFRGGDGMEELSDRLALSCSMLYRISNPTDDGAHLSCKHLIPLMEATKDDAPLKHLCAARGYLSMRLPKARTAREGELAELQRLQSTLNLALIGFLAGTRTQDETLDAIRQEMEKSAGFLKLIQAYPQQPLFEEGS
jgi:hypothetical protein